MPVRNPPGLYGGGAFKIDSTAATDYYLKQKAKEDAKAEALEKYFSELPDKVNSAGMRKKDRIAFDASIKNAKSFFYENKDGIVKGNSELRRKYDELLKVPLEIALGSKAEFDTDKQLASIYKSPEIKERITNETLGLDETGKPIIDPTTGSKMGIAGHDEPTHIVDPSGKVAPNPAFKSFDFSSLTYNPKLLDAVELEKIAKLATVGIPTESTIVDIPNPKNPYQKIRTKETFYNKEALKKIGDVSGNYFDSDKQLQYTINKTNPASKFKDPANAEEYNRLNKVFNQIYGKNIENERDRYVASIIDKNSVKDKDQNIVDDPVALAKFRSSLSLSNQEKLYRMRGGGAGPNFGPTGHAFDAFPEGETVAGNITFTNGKLTNPDGTPYVSKAPFDLTISRENLPPDILDILGYSKKPQSEISEIRASVKDGKIVGIKIPGYTTINRTGFKERQRRLVVGKKQGYEFNPAEEEEESVAPPPSQRGSKFPGLIRNK